MGIHFYGNSCCLVCRCLANRLTSALLAAFHFSPSNEATFSNVFRYFSDYFCIELAFFADLLVAAICGVAAGAARRGGV